MVTPIASATSAASGAAATAQKGLANNFDTFLTLLTAQLRNQDPLSPMDSTQFTEQLVQFSQVEQQISANKNLETLIGLTQSRAGIDAVNYLGKTLTMTDGSNALRNGSAEWSYTLEVPTASTVVTVSNARGKIVYAAPGQTGAGSHTFVWDGKDNAGNPLPDGAYTLSVKGALNNGDKVTAALVSKGIVDQVDLSRGEPLLMIGPLGIPLSKASLVSGL